MRDLRSQVCERGAALPLVLVVTLAMVILVSDLSLRVGVALDRTRRSVRMAESRGLTKRIEQGLARLSREMIMSMSEEAKEFNVDDFKVRLSVELVESKINIRMLDHLTQGPAIQELFGALLKTEKFENRALPCVIDWIDEDEDPRESGAERSDYSGEDAIPRNAPFETLDELSFVYGFRDVSSFDRIRPLLTAYGSGRIYIPSATPRMMDLFESVFGTPVRNRLEDMKRNPGSSLQIPKGMMPEKMVQTLHSLIAEEPVTWTVTIELRSASFFSRTEYLVEHGFGPGGENRVTRIG